MSSSGNADNNTGKQTQKQGGRYKGGRGFNRTSRGNGSASSKITTDTSFKGTTLGMRGHVFQCYNESKDRNQFNKTLEALRRYISTTMTHSGDMSDLTKKLARPTITKPTVPAADETDAFVTTLFNKQMTGYSAKLDQLESNLKAAYDVVWGQCSEALQSKLKSSAKFEEHDDKSDCVWLILEIRGIMLEFENERNLNLSLSDAHRVFEMFEQGDLTLPMYLEQYNNLVETIVHYGGTIGTDPGLLKLCDQTKTVEAQKKEAKDRYLGILFVKKANRTQFGALWADLENQHSRGLNQYPNTVTGAYSMLVNYVNNDGIDKKKTAHTHVSTGQVRTGNQQKAATAEPTATGMTFTQANNTGKNPVPGNDGNVYAHITCLKCKDKGHYANQCPSHEDVSLLQAAEVDYGYESGGDDDDEQDDEYTTGDEDIVERVMGFSFTQTTRDIIPESWVLLDSQSTVSVFKNRRMLDNIRKSKGQLKVFTNGGTQISNQIGDIKNFGTVWYNPESLANILSLAEVRKNCRVTMDTHVEPAITVHKTDGTTMKFVEYVNGLYFYETGMGANSKRKIDKITSDDVKSYSFVSTVSENEKRFHRREVVRARQARVLYRQLGSPSQKSFEHYLANNLIRNCPITVDDARRAVIIYGPDVAFLKGRSTKGPSTAVESFVPIGVPETVLFDHQKVTIAIDFFFVQGQQFFHSISRKIKFRTVSRVNDGKKSTIKKEIRSVVKAYDGRGFDATSIHADMQFECVQNDFLPIQMNITANDDHVGDVERSVRTIKELVRTEVHRLPYKRYPKIMITALVTRAIRCLNQFPAADGVSDVMSPLTIMTGLPNVDFNTLKLDFLGAYAMVFEDNDPSNTTKSRATGAIVLNPTGNAQEGDYFFMSLTTGRRISRHQWTVLPLTDAAIAAVEAIALEEKQPIISGGCPLFEWEPDAEILDEDDVIARHAVPIANDVEDDTQEVVVPDVDLTVNDVDDIMDDNLPENNNGNAPDQGANANDENAANQGATTDDAEEDANEEDAIHNPDGVEAEREDVCANNLQQVGHAYNLRSDRGRDYGHMYDGNFQMLQEGTPEWESQGTDGMRQHVFGYVMTQMTASAGIKKHGEYAIEALFAEFSQLHEKGVFKPMNAGSMSAEQRKGALRAINLIKEKRCGKLKGRSVADGRPQRALYSREEITSPTVSTDSLMLTLMVDALEGRDVATADVTGAYLNADMDDFTVLKLQGDAVDIMCSVNKDYEPFIVKEHGKKVLYLQLLKALYGCVRSALLWYELFTEKLQNMGFELNPYDPCVANKVINGSQCTVAWYVDDNKISHVDPTVVDGVIKAIESNFGKMSVTRGLEHTFLGMKITFDAKKRELRLDMKDYVTDVIHDFGEPITKGVSTPATKNLFDIGKDEKPLGIKRAEDFHRLVAKLLYISKRGRPDILLPVAFLCTRVSRSTDEDWVKLRRVLQYLFRTMSDFAVLGADSMSKMTTWVDAAYGVHDDMKSHTGGGLSLGKGLVMCKSSKQKLNTKSSTEAELVGASDFLPSTIWAKMFLKAQGFDISENLFAQDNESAIKLERNGRASCGQKSRHIDIRYFFIKDRIRSENINIV